MKSLTLQQLLPHITLPDTLIDKIVRHWRVDSRQVRPGDGFVAIQGTHADGRQFIEQAIHAGAILVLVEGSVYHCYETNKVPCVEVPDLKSHLGEVLSLHYGTATQLPVAAVTGTNGKTSVTGFIEQLMLLLHEPWGLLGTFGACYGGDCEDLGLTTADPATIHRCWAEFREQGAHGLVLEASSHALVQDRLMGLPVDAAVWTNLGRDHLDYHGTMEAYAEAKTLLFKRPGIKHAIFSRDNEQVVQLLEPLTTEHNVVTFGAHDSNDICYTDLSCQLDGLSFVLKNGDQQWPIKMPLYGAFNVENVLAAVATLVAYGKSIEELVPLLPNLTPVLGRMEQVPAEQGPTVLVDFAHTADGLDAALTALAAHFGGNIHCVFGCGGDRDKGKRPLMAKTAEAHAKTLWVTSDNPRTEDPQAIIDDIKAGLSGNVETHESVDRADAICSAIAQAKADDVVLIAGKGHEREQIIGTEKHLFSDAAVAATALTTWRQAL